MKSVYSTEAAGDPPSGDSARPDAVRLMRADDDVDGPEDAGLSPQSVTKMGWVRPIPAPRRDEGCGILT
jgi:hypothetical protein